MISVKGLTIADHTGRRVVDDVTFEVLKGLNVALVGQSGSGKSTTALAILGLVRPGLRRLDGEVKVNGEDLLRATPRRVRAVRRKEFAYLGQDPSSSLTPTMRIGRLLTELAISPIDPSTVLARMAAFGLPHEPEILRRYPHELSGGQRQRLALARALTNDPAVLVLDEPTTGLDPITQKLVLDEVAAVAERTQLTMLVISHDLSVVARFADDLLVMKDGKVVDRGTATTLLSNPKDEYTKHLVAVAPRMTLREIPAEGDPSGPALHVDSLSATHRTERRTVPILRDVTLHALKGECVAVVGPSGSGKTTFARCVAGLHRPDTGEIRLAGERLEPTARNRSIEHRRLVQLVPQDPGGSLNPRRSVEEILQRPLIRMRSYRDQPTIKAEVERLLELVQLAPRVLKRRPRELSGGERQRVALARALAADPAILVCDEMTSALDVSVQHQILLLVNRLREELSLTTLFITHDLGVVSMVADRVAVLDHGAVCEKGPVRRVLGSPEHALTRALVTAAPSLDDELAERSNRLTLT